MTKHNQLALLLLVGLLGPLQQSANAQQALRPGLATTFCYPRQYDWGWGDTMCSIEFDNGMSIPDATGQTWSPDGVRLAYVGVGGVHVKDRSTGTTTVILPMDLNALNWSPDGARIAGFGWVGDTIEGAWELLTVAPDGSGLSRLTNRVGFGGSYAWSPSGAAIAFGRAVGGIQELFVMKADGSNPVQLTSGVGFRNGGISWSPDGARIAFGCGTTYCAVNADGTNLVPLLASTGVTAHAVWGPNGEVAFLRPGSQGFLELFVEDRNGSVRHLAPGINAASPVWSPDGARLAFVKDGGPEYGGPACNGDGSPCYPPDLTLVVNADGSGLGLALGGYNPTWAPRQPGQPSAAFTSACTAQGCRFDSTGAFDPDGTITNYSWAFGDGTTGSGPAPTHVYAIGGWYDVALTVTDNAGKRDVIEARVFSNQLPTASFVVTCNGPVCTFDASASLDPDGGTISQYQWFFGDGGRVDGPAIVTHSYRTGTFTPSLVVWDAYESSNAAQRTVSVVNQPPVASFTVSCVGLRCSYDASSSSDADDGIAYVQWTFSDGSWAIDGVTGTRDYGPGTHTITLTVIDAALQAVTTSRTFTVAPLPPVPIHIGDIDGSTQNQSNTWNAFATIQVHTSAHGGAGGITVTGVWDDGTAASCTTESSGRCVVGTYDIARKTNTVTFTITRAVAASFVYDRSANHDADRDSNGTVIRIRRP